MKKLVTFIFILGITFGGFGLLYSIFNLACLNGIGVYFKMETPTIIHLEIKQDSIYTDISYVYKTLKGDELSESYRMSTRYYNEQNLDSISIKYNKTFPFVSYIEGIPLILENQKTGVVLSLIFMIFITVCCYFARKDSYLKRYEQLGNRPWIFPADKTIKNPWKRFWKRLFNKELADKYDNGLL